MATWTCTECTNACGEISHSYSSAAQAIGAAKALLAADDFRRIIDRVIQHGGRYYLTYHRWANRKQVETCYPKFVEFLRLKKKYDPTERLQSDWYRHHKAMFADAI